MIASMCEDLEGMTDKQASSMLVFVDRKVHVCNFRGLKYVIFLNESKFNLFGLYFY
jgi:hypothetical protein